MPEASPESEAADAYVATLSEEARLRLLDEFLYRAAVIALAGPEAERLLAPGTSEAEVEATSRADRRVAAARLWDRSDSPRHLQRSLNRAEAEARSLVRRYSTEIILLACALAERKQLSATEVRKAVEEAARLATA